MCKARNAHTSLYEKCGFEFVSSVGNLFEDNSEELLYSTSL